MIHVSVYKQGNFPVSSPKIKKGLREFFTRKGIVSDAEVSVAVVNDKKMMGLVKKYVKDGKLHNVLSFTPSEVKEKFIYPPEGKIDLGEIIICYPVVVAEAKREGKLIDEKAYELIEHGALHLLGIHHK